MGRAGREEHANARQDGARASLVPVMESVLEIDPSLGLSLEGVFCAGDFSYNLDRQGAGERGGGRVRAGVAPIAHTYM